MKSRLIVAMLVAGFMTAGYQSSAQMKALKKFKDVVGGKTEDKGYAALSYDDHPFAPAVMQTSLMTHIDFSKNGYFTLDHVSVVFPPKSDVEGNPVDYNEQERFHIKLLKGDELVYDCYYKPQFTYDISTKFQRNAAAERNVNVDYRTDRFTLDEGEYRLDFYFDDQQFSTFPFTVYAIKTDDPYAKDKAKYFVKGFWNDYGYFSWADNGSGQDKRLQWNYWMQFDESLTEYDKDITAYLELYRDGKMVADTRKGRTTGAETSIEDEWDRYWDVLFVDALAETGDENNRYRAFEPRDLKDGSYELRTFIDGTQSGTYTFEVKNNKMVPNGRQVRENTDPLQFIEGTNEAIFLKNSK